MNSIKTVLANLKKRASRSTGPVLNRSQDYSDGIQRGIDMAIKMIETEFYFELQEDHDGHSENSSDSISMPDLLSDSGNKKAPEVGTDRIENLICLGNKL